MTARGAGLRLMVEQLGSTGAGRELGLHRLRSLDDLRATMPIRGRSEHRAEVESKFAFGAIDASSMDEVATAERDIAVAVWRRFLGERMPKRVALLLGRHFDDAVDKILVDDLRELGGELLRIHAWEDTEEILERLKAFDPHLLVVPSVLTCRALEAVERAPLEHSLRHLRMILAEHDLERTLRSRVPVNGAGWIHASGRLALPAHRLPDESMTLAVGTSILELLPYSNPEEDGRRVYASSTVLPEHAFVGQRYELVVSSPQGFVRLRTGEHVRVVGFDSPTGTVDHPRARVVRLAPAPADVRLEGCTVAGSWLTASVRQALHREDPALVFAEIGPDPLSIPMGAAALRTGSAKLPEAFKDTELGWLAKTGMHRVVRKKPKGLLLRIEVQGFVGPELPMKLSSRVDANLRRRSPAYAHLRESDDLQQPRVLVVPAGTQFKDEARRIAALGPNVGLPEVRVVES